MKQKRTLEELKTLASYAVERGQELRELRLLAGVSLERAGQWLRLSIAMVFNFESGTVPVSPERYAALKTFYLHRIAARQARAAEIAGKGSK